MLFISKIYSTLSTLSKFPKQISAVLESRFIIENTVNIPHTKGSFKNRASFKL